MRNRTLIIAEAGVNHNGDLDKARELIRVARWAGADVVKFQTFKADKLVSRSAKKAEYQQRNIGDGDNSQYTMLKKLELPDEWHFELDTYSRSLGIEFISTAFDEESADFLNTFNPRFFKIPSGEITNKPYLEHIARMNREIILSTGMANIEEIKDALNIIEASGLPGHMVTILHCNTDYPTAMIDVNLMAMVHMRDTFNLRVGYSDHTLGIEVPIAAVALGAVVIEKHFTLDRSLPGPDHKASLEPDELKSMVMAIRNIEQTLAGSGIKEPSISESRNIAVARKSIHLASAVSKGQVLARHHLVMKRPGDGISPMSIDRVIGRKLATDLEADTKLTWENLE